MSEEPELVVERREHTLVARLNRPDARNALSPEVVARIMMSEHGGMKGIPATATKYLLITHATENQQDIIQELSRVIVHLPGTVHILYSAHPREWLASETRR